MIFDWTISSWKYLNQIRKSKFQKQPKVVKRINQNRWKLHEFDKVLFIELEDKRNCHVIFFYIWFKIKTLFEFTYCSAKFQCTKTLFFRPNFTKNFQIQKCGRKYWIFLANTTSNIKILNDKYQINAKFSLKIRILRSSDTGST